jgi:hypothetical protein
MTPASSTTAPQGRARCRKTTFNEARSRDAARRSLGGSKCRACRLGFRRHRYRLPVPPWIIVMLNRAVRSASKIGDGALPVYMQQRVRGDLGPWGCTVSMAIIIVHEASLESRSCWYVVCFSVVLERRPSKRTLSSCAESWQASSGDCSCLKLSASTSGSLQRAIVRTRLR